MHRDKTYQIARLIKDCVDEPRISLEKLKTGWDALEKLIKAQSLLGKNVLIFDVFYCCETRVNNTIAIRVTPTNALVTEAGLKYRADLNDIDYTKVVQVSEPNLAKVSGTNYLNETSSPQRMYEGLCRIFKSIKNLIVHNKSTSLDLEFLGCLEIYDKTFMHTPQYSRSKLQSRGSPQLPKDFGRTFLRDKSLQILSPFRQEVTDQSQFRTEMRETKRNFGQKTKRNLYYEVDPSKAGRVKVDNDMLGAGIDPLTYDYNLSNLTSNPKQLMEKSFVLPAESEKRYPCIIDRFSQTIGSQLTGTKVSTSCVIRIGSNYSPLMHNVHLDPDKKSIVFISPEIRIKLSAKNLKPLESATQQEQYKYILVGESSLASKVNLLRKYYERYLNYINHMIPNNCVAPLPQTVIQNIVNQIKSVARKLGKAKASPLSDQLINQVNADYYFAYKKAVLDYILLSEDERARTGIERMFSTVQPWGHHHESVSRAEGGSGDYSRVFVCLQKQLLQFPDAMSEVMSVCHSLTQLDLFPTPQPNQIRPVNVLYYLKKHSSHLETSVLKINEGWVKKIAAIIIKRINLSSQLAQKVSKFLNSIHVLMSEKLRSLVYSALNNIETFYGIYVDPNQSEKARPFLQLGLAEENGNIVFVDDLSRVFKTEIVQLIDLLANFPSQIARLDISGKEEDSKGFEPLDRTDSIYKRVRGLVESILTTELVGLEAFRTSLRKFNHIHELRESLNEWKKESHSVSEVKQKIAAIHAIEADLKNLKLFHARVVTTLDCLEVRRKLFTHCVKVKVSLCEYLEERVNSINSEIINLLQNRIQEVERGVKSTQGYVMLIVTLEQLRVRQLKEINGNMAVNHATLLGMFEFDSFYCVSSDLLRNVYKTFRLYQILLQKIFINEERAAAEKIQLEKNLRKRIQDFQTETTTLLAEVVEKLESFTIRRLASDYLLVLGEYKSVVQQNRALIHALNRQEEDLRWALTTFTSANEIEALVEPCYELWVNISEFQGCLREWRIVELSQFNIEPAEAKITQIDQRINKLVSRMKSKSCIKVRVELQNEIREFLLQQVPIIKIFCHDGLKERHWHLFSKKLVVPGYDLREITLGKIRVLYEYEKNLKVLTSISNQAAKQFQIESEKNAMNEYWVKLSFQLKSRNEEKLIFIKSQFLLVNLALIEDHIISTSLLKNSPFSKALVPMLSEWETWLVTSQRILSLILKAQEKISEFEDIFRIDEVGKTLPFEASELQSLENIWKSIIKKINEQKLFEFCKSQKIPQILEEIVKKATFVRFGLTNYLNQKRNLLPRLYFVQDEQIMKCLSLASVHKDQQSFERLFKHCFKATPSHSKIDFKTEKMISGIDELKLQYDSTHETSKAKIKVFSDLCEIHHAMKRSILQQVTAQLKESIHQANICLTAALCARLINFTLEIKSSLLAKQNLQQLANKRTNFLKKPEKQIDLIVTKISQSLRQQILLAQDVWERDYLAKFVRASITSVDSFEYLASLKFTKQNKIYISSCYSSVEFGAQYEGAQAKGHILTLTDRTLHSIIMTVESQIAGWFDNASRWNLLRELGCMFAFHVVSLSAFKLTATLLCQGLTATEVWVIADGRCQSKDWFQSVSSRLEMIQTALKDKLNKIKSYGVDLQLASQRALFIRCEPTYFRSIPNRCKDRFRNLTLSKPDLLSCLYSVQIDHWEPESKAKYFSLSASSCSCIPYQPIQTLKALLQIDSFPLSRKEKTAMMNQRMLSSLDADSSEVYQEFLRVQNAPTQPRQPLSMGSFQYFNPEGYSRLKVALQSFSQVVIYGEYSSKSTLVRGHLKDSGYTEETIIQRFVNLDSLIEFSDSEITAYFKKLLQFNSQNPLSTQYLHLETQSLDVRIILLLKHQIEQLRIEGCKIICEISDLQKLSPGEIVSFGKVHIESKNLLTSVVYTAWVKKMKLQPEHETILMGLSQPLDGFLTLLFKVERFSPLQSRFVLVQRFLRLFQLHIEQMKLESVIYEGHCDLQGCYVNIFAFSLHWAIAMGSLHPKNYHLVTKYLKNAFGQKLDIDGEIDDYFLNEDNQWVSWRNLKQDPQLDDVAPDGLHTLWTPTEACTKLYTMIIRLTDSKIPVFVFGKQSGKTALLRELTNFELSCSAFTLQCHKQVSVRNFMEVIRCKVLFGKNKKNLIMVDDVELPENNHLHMLLKGVVQDGTIANVCAYGKPVDSLDGPSTLFTCSEVTCASLCRLTAGMVTFYMKPLTDDIQSLYRPFVSSWLSNFQNLAKIQNPLFNLLGRLVKQFPQFTIHEVGRSLKFAICKDINESSEAHLAHPALQFWSLVYRSFSHKNQGNFKQANLIKILEADFSKAYPGVLRGSSDFAKQMETLTLGVSPNTLAAFRELLMTRLSETNQQEPVLPDKLVSYIYSLKKALQQPAFHCIIVADKFSGVDKLLKLTAVACSFEILKLPSGSNGSLIVDSVTKLLKMGGKMDQCLCPIKLSQHGALLPYVTELIVSAEMYGFFGLIGLEQVIKSFNSDKKFLKKDIRKVEFMKKVRQKVNEIFHFCFVIESSEEQEFIAKYPKLWSSCYVLRVDPWANDGVKALIANFNLDDGLSSVLLRISNLLESQIKPHLSTLQFLELTLQNLSSLKPIQERRLEQYNETVSVWNLRLKMQEKKLAKVRDSSIDFGKKNSAFVNDSQAQIAKIKSLKEQFSIKQRDARIAMEKRDSVKSRLSQANDSLINLTDTLKPQLQKAIQSETLVGSVVSALRSPYPVARPIYRKLCEFTALHDNIQSFSEQYSQQEPNKAEFSKFLNIVEVHWSKLKEIEVAVKMLSQLETDASEIQEIYWKATNEFREIDENIEQLETNEVDIKKVQGLRKEQQELTQKRNTMEGLISYMNTIVQKLSFPKLYAFAYEADETPTLLYVALRISGFRYGMSEWSAVEAAISQFYPSFQVQRIQILLPLRVQLKFRFEEQFSVEKVMTLLGVEVSSFFCIIVDPNLELPSFLEQMYPGREIRCADADTTVISMAHERALIQGKNTSNESCLMLLEQPAKSTISDVLSLHLQNNDDGEKEHTEQGGLQQDKYRNTELSLLKTTKIVFVYRSLKDVDPELLLQTSWIAHMQSGHKLLKSLFIKSSITSKSEDMTVKKHQVSEILKLIDLFTLEDNKLYSLLVKRDSGDSHGRMEESYQARQSLVSQIHAYQPITHNRDFLAAFSSVEPLFSKYKSLRPRQFLKLSTEYLTAPEPSNFFKLETVLQALHESPLNGIKNLTLTTLLEFIKDRIGVYLNSLQSIVDLLSKTILFINYRGLNLINARSLLMEIFKHSKNPLSLAQIEQLSREGPSSRQNCLIEIQTVKQWQQMKTFLTLDEQKPIPYRIVVLYDQDFVTKPYYFSSYLELTLQNSVRDLLLYKVNQWVYATPNCSDKLNLLLKLLQFAERSQLKPAALQVCEWILSRPLECYSMFEKEVDFLLSQQEA